MADTVKVGPWGAPGGQHHDINVGSMPQHLETITISWEGDSGNGRIIGISFAYIDQNKQKITVDPWGMIDSEHSKTIEIQPDEQLYLISGTFDNSDGVTSVMLTTSQHEHGPFGCHAGPEFSVPLKHGDGEVVAFFGRSNDTLQELGVYVLGKTGLPVMIGPWGGPSNVDITTPVQLKGVTVRSTQRINGFSFTYVDQCRKPIPVGPWGSTDEPPQPFTLNPGEYVNKITGTFDNTGVTSLQFTTNQKPEGYGPFGRSVGTAFSVPLAENVAVLGFFGGKGGSLLAIGVYVGAVPNEP